MVLPKSGLRLDIFDRFNISDLIFDDVFDVLIYLKIYLMMCLIYLNALLLPKSCLRLRKAFSFAVRSRRRGLYGTLGQPHHNSDYYYYYYYYIIIIYGTLGQPHPNSSDHCSACKTSTIYTRVKLEKSCFPNFSVFHILVLLSFRIA